MSVVDLVSLLVRVDRELTSQIMYPGEKPNPIQKMMIDTKLGPSARSD